MRNSANDRKSMLNNREDHPKRLLIDFSLGKDVTGIREVTYHTNCPKRS
jgi:hypothetical protein